MIKHAIVFILLLLPGTTSAHFFEGQDQRVDVTNEGYPYRAIGKLTRQLSNGKSFACTAFLTGPSEITTARHCLIDKITGKYVKEVFFTLHVTTPASSQKQTHYRIRAPVPQYGKTWIYI